MANLIAAGFRNGWAYIVIVCGHFVDGAEKFTPEAVENETKPEWYLRQMLGTANFNAGPVLRIMSGNLCYQIEHHLFPDLPSNRLPEIAARVQPLLAEYDLPYTTGPLIRQFWHTVRTICKLSLPDRFLSAYLRRCARDGVRGKVPRRADACPDPRNTRVRYATARIGDRDLGPCWATNQTRPDSALIATHRGHCCAR